MSVQDKLTRYLLDPTGKNPDNFVRNESRLLRKNKIRTIIPYYGAFFANSVTVFDVSTKRALNFGEDYCTAGLMQKETLLYGENISSVILITNRQVSDNVTFNYQCLGSNHERNNEALESLLKKDLPQSDNTIYSDIAKLPTTFKPSFHHHDFGDMYGLDYLVYLLERIKLAIIWKKVDMVVTVVDYINDYINALYQDLSSAMDHEFYNQLMSFRRNFNKEVYSLGLLKNYGPIEDSVVKNIASGEPYQQTDEAYLTLQGITALKEELYSSAVALRSTQLGKISGSYIGTNLNAFHSSPIGSVFVLGSYEANEKQGDAINVEVYPDPTKKTTAWSIKKLSARGSQVGHLFLATALEDGVTYFGALTSNEDSELRMVWKTLLNNFNLNFLGVLEDHLSDKTNPHKDHKSRIKLGNVENLPVASREQIVCNIPSRSYITFENLMLYMKRFMTGEKSVHDIDLVENPINTQRRMQAIFSPCGPCNTDLDEWSLVNDCMVMEPPTQAPEALLETNKNLIDQAEDTATLTAYLQDFTPSAEVVIKVYRRVVNYEVPTAPPPVTQDPSIPVVYTVLWDDCDEAAGLTCDVFKSFIEVGDSKKIAPNFLGYKTATVRDNKNTASIPGVTWTMVVSDIAYKIENTKPLISKLVETGSVYALDSAQLKVYPGVMDDFAVRGLYSVSDTVAATRSTKFTASKDGVVLGSIYYVNEFKIDVKNT